MNTSLALGENLESEYNHAFKLGQNNKLEDAYKEFNQLCTDKKYIPACLSKAYHLRYGLGTNKNPEEAIKIYSEYANQGHEEALLDYASMLEYEYGNDINNVNTIADIYNSLLNSQFQYIRDRAAEGLIRLYSMKVYHDFWQAYYKFYRGKISYEVFEEQLNNIDLHDVIPLIKNTFIIYRKSILKEAKNIGVGNKASDHFMWALKNGLQIASGNFNLLHDIPDAYANRDNLKKQAKDFYGAYKESGLSIPLYNATLKYAKDNS